jgi:hypothetical protein
MSKIRHFFLRFRHITLQRAEEELVLLFNRLEEVTLGEESDERFMRFAQAKHFSAKSDMKEASDYDISSTYQCFLGSKGCLNRLRCWRSWMQHAAGKG